jgi:hypothetical protein
VSDTAWTPYFLVACLIALVVWARRYARGVPRTRPRLIRVEERNLPRHVPPLAATAARSLEELGFVPLGWLQCWIEHEKVENPFIQVLRHPESAAIASLTVVGDAHELPVRVHLSTKLQDGWSVQTWDGCVGRVPVYEDRTRRRESWALTIGGLYRDHLRFVAREGSPADPAETSVQAMVERDVATHDEDWQRFLDAGWLRRGKDGQWRPNFLRVLVHVPLFLWSEYVYGILGLLRGRRWTAEIHRQRSVRPQHTLGGILDTHGLWFALLGVALAAVLMLPKLSERNRRPGPRQLPGVGAPLFGPLMPPAGAAKLEGLVPFEGGLLGIEPDGPNTALLWWADPRQPPARVLSVEGAVRELEPAPAGGRCALRVAPHREDGGDAAVTVAVVEREGWRYLPLQKEPRVGLGGAIWSATGDRLALGEAAHSDRRAAVTRIYELPSGRMSAAAETINAVPVDWSSSGWLLRGGSKDPARPFAHHRWQPGAPPRPLAAGELAAESRDGRFRAGVRGNAVVVEEGGATRTVPLSGFEGQIIVRFLSSIRESQWLSTDHLLFPLERMVALDLSTGKLTYLFSETDVELEATSPDGRWATALDQTGRYLWATRR